VAKLVYSVIASLDGYVADEHDNFEWAAPTTRCTRSSTTSSGRSALLYGRRMYDRDGGWETMPVAADEPGVTTTSRRSGGGRQGGVLDDTRAASTPRRG